MPSEYDPETRARLTVWCSITAMISPVSGRRGHHGCSSLHNASRTDRQLPTSSHDREPGTSTAETE
jgi:hypothetical protein